MFPSISSLFLKEDQSLPSNWMKAPWPVLSPLDPPLSKDAKAYFKSRVALAKGSSSQVKPSARDYLVPSA